VKIHHGLSLLSRAESIAQLRKLNSPWHLRNAVRSPDGRGRETRLDRLVPGRLDAPWLLLVERPTFD
jgi:hypothetical protein